MGWRLMNWAGIEDADVLAMITISIRNGDRFYRAHVTIVWARRHDNGALISCGLTVGQDLSSRVFARLGSRAVEITREQWNHSGCQSACTLRGAAECRW